MVSYADIQNAYNKVYAELRKYIWDFSTVSAIADLEIAVYKTCQDLRTIRILYSRLRSMINDAVREDEELGRRLKFFEDLIATDQVYVKLNQVEEVIPL